MKEVITRARNQYGNNYYITFYSEARWLLSAGSRYLRLGSQLAETQIERRQRWWRTDKSRMCLTTSVHR